MATATRTARKAPAKRSAPAGKAVASAPAVKTKKAKLVRDSFNIPKTEYAVLEELKARAASLGRPAKKSEVLRAGVQALAAMKDAAFLDTLGKLAPVKAATKA